MSASELNSTRKPPHEVLIDLIDEMLGNFGGHFKSYPFDVYAREPIFGDPVPALYGVLDGEEIQFRTISDNKHTLEKEMVRIMFYTKDPSQRWWFKQIIKQILIGNSKISDTKSWSDVGLHWFNVQDVSYGVAYDGHGEVTAFSVSVLVELTYQADYYNLKRE
jgi:hypothetical protein